MGPSIYCAVERIDESGRWKFVRTLHLKRNLLLFTILGGSMAYLGTVAPIATTRGLPRDLDSDSITDEDCPLAPGEAEEFGDRDRSWLTLLELRSYDWSRNIIADDGPAVPIRQECSAFCAWMDAQNAPADRLRIVFGFDN